MPASISAFTRVFDAKRASRSWVPLLQDERMLYLTHTPALA